MKLINFDMILNLNEYRIFFEWGIQEFIDLLIDEEHSFDINPQRYYYCFSM